MVARGDMGLEMPLERVPRVQKEITRHARALRQAGDRRDAGLRFDATEPRPTRAEVSDAANAVDDAVDAIMLSGETAVGEYPGEDGADAGRGDSRCRIDHAVAGDRTGRERRRRRAQSRAVRGRGDARRRGRGGGDCRGHGEGQDRARAVRVPSGRADLRGHAERGRWRGGSRSIEASRRSRRKPGSSLDATGMLVERELSVDAAC